MEYLYSMARTCNFGRGSCFCLGGLLLHDS